MWNTAQRSRSPCERDTPLDLSSSEDAPRQIDELQNEVLPPPDNPGDFNPTRIMMMLVTDATVEDPDGDVHDRGQSKTFLQGFVTTIDLDFGFRNMKLFQILFDFTFARLKLALILQV
jgi:hypothetical protein